VLKAGIVQVSVHQTIEKVLMAQLNQSELIWVSSYHYSGQLHMLQY
jgi:hypothetical protein